MSIEHLLNLPVFTLPACTPIVGNEKAALALSELTQSLKKVDPNPTDKQKEAGNYVKAHVTWKGLDLTIETAKGQYRRGTAADGKPWRTLMRDSYGYIKRTLSEADGDHIDIFLCDEYLDSEIIFIVNQVDPQTKKWDEHKVILGTISAEQAKTAYLRNYEKGWQGFDSIAAMTLAQFRKWLADGDTSKKAEDVHNPISAELPYRDRAEMYAQKDGKVYGSIYPDTKAFGVYGGGIDPGENPLQAAVREFAEESGWNVKNPQMLPVGPYVHEWTPPFHSEQQRERAKQYRGSRTYYITGELGDQIPDAKPDAVRENARLYSLDDAMKLAVPPDQKTLIGPNQMRLAALQHLQNEHKKQRTLSKFIQIKYAEDTDERPFYVAVDLDGTLAKTMKPFDPKTIGRPRPNAKVWMERFREAGAKLIIFTVRGNDKLVKTWLDEHEIPYDYINENPDQPRQSSGKIFADVYFDDRGIDARDLDLGGAEVVDRIEESEADPDEETMMDSPVLTIQVTRTRIVMVPEPQE